MSTFINVNQSVNALIPISIRRKHQRRRCRPIWVPYGTDLGANGTPATGANITFNAPSNWVLTAPDGNITRDAIAFTEQSTFYYVPPNGPLPVNNAAYFTVTVSSSSPTGYIATFSLPPVPLISGGQPVPTSVYFSYNNFQFIPQV